MANIQDILASKKGISGNSGRLTSGFDVNPAISSGLVNETDLEPKKILFDYLGISPFNTYSVNPDDVEELAESISRIGILDYPIAEMRSVDHYEILSGQKRFLAVGRLRKTDRKRYDELFPGDCIPGRILDMKSFRLSSGTGTVELSEEGRRTLVIAAGNQQHEKTVSDYMLQVEQFASVYAELKEKGLIPAGERQREFIADNVALQTRSVQKVLNAKRDLPGDLWKALMECRLLESVSVLEEISRLPYNIQMDILADIRAGKEIILPGKEACQAKAPPRPVFRPSPRDHMFGAEYNDCTVSPDRLENLFAMPEFRQTLNSFRTEVRITPDDMRKLEDIGMKMEKLRLSTEKILKKYT